MEIKTYPMKVAEGKVYAEVTLRDVVERAKDLSDTPMLAEIKRLYDENDRLRELVRDAVQTLGPPALRVDEIECGTIYEAHISRLEQRMRELGVEV